MNARQSFIPCAANASPHANDATTFVATLTRRRGPPLKEPVAAPGGAKEFPCAQKGRDDDFIATLVFASVELEKWFRSRWEGGELAFPK